MWILAAQIVRFVDNSFPGWVACQFVDAEGRQHTIIDKVPVISLEDLDVNSAYPRPGSVACTILDRWVEAGGRELARISTQTPWAIESTEGVSEFVVDCGQLSSKESS